MEYKNVEYGLFYLYDGLTGIHEHLNGTLGVVTQIREPEVIHTKSMDGLLIVGAKNLLEVV